MPQQHDKLGNKHGLSIGNVMLHPAHYRIYPHYAPFANYLHFQQIKKGIYIFTHLLHFTR